MRVGRDDPKTLQDFLARKLSLSRRGAKDIVDSRRVWVNRKCVWMARYALETGDIVDVSAEIPKAPKKFHIRVLWSDGDYMVVDKPAGILSCGDAKSVEAMLREQEGMPGLEAVHRLDRDTTGCLMFAKNHAALEAAIGVFKARKVSKIYHAVAVGRFKFAHQTVDAPLDGQDAVSNITREAVGDEASFLKIRIETGRTNQIRRHLASIRFPVVGDRVFGLKNARDPRFLRVPRQMLHASSLALPDPQHPKQEIKVHSPLPADFRAALKLFGMGKGRTRK